jgi:predicted PurR-regulated permease PerM
MKSASMRTTTAELLEYATFILAFALLLFLLWLLFDVVLIVVGATLVAVLLRLGAEPLVRQFKIPQHLALTLSGFFIAGVIGGAAYLFGSHIGSELQDVLQRANEAQKGIVANLQQSKFGNMLLSHVVGANLSVTQILTRVFTISANFVEALVITVLTGIYFAAQPSLYRSGLIKLFPRRWRANAAETVDDIGSALRLWLLGQLLQMLIVGLLSAFATWLIGLPSPLALGLIAGILEFIPYLGPILAAIPAILVATTKDFDAVIWTIVAYVIIHQTEGNLLVPIIQRHMVSIPPALILLGIVTISFVFGTVAMIFAAPIAVILFVLVKKLYVRDSLGERTTIPGETS